MCGGRRRVSAPISPLKMVHLGYEVPGRQASFGILLQACATLVCRWFRHLVEKFNLEMCRWLIRVWTDVRQEMFARSRLCTQISHNRVWMWASEAWKEWSVNQTITSAHCRTVVAYSSYWMNFNGYGLRSLIANCVQKRYSCILFSLQTVLF